MNRKHASIGAVISACAIVATLLVPLTFGSVVQQDNAGDVPNGSDNTQPYDPTVDTIPVVALCGPVEESKPWNTYSTPKVEPGNLAMRQYPAAIVRPYTATTTVESRSETFEINCANMTELSQHYKEAANMPDALVAKEWINAFNNTVKDKGLDSFYEVGPGGTTVVSPLGRIYAEYMNAFISQFKMEGQQTLDSLRYWMMGPYNPQHVPTVQLAGGKDTKPSWIYTWYNKFDECQWRFGVNPAGGELVVYTCDTPAPEPTPTPTNPPHVPTCEELYGPGSTTGPTGLCKDPEGNAVYNNPGVDPFYNGSAPPTSDGDGSQVANGNQGTEADVLAAQEAAAAKAAAEQAARDEAARKAAEDAANKAANQGGSGSTAPGW